MVLVPREAMVQQKGSRVRRHLIQDRGDAGGRGEMVISKMVHEFYFQKQSNTAKLFSVGETCHLLSVLVCEIELSGLVHINDESQIYSKLLVIGFNFILAHFVLRINTLERQEDPRAEGLALSFWRVCTLVLCGVSCLQAQDRHMFIDSWPHTVRKVAQVLGGRGAGSGGRTGVSESQSVLAA